MKQSFTLQAAARRIGLLPLGLLLALTFSHTACRDELPSPSEPQTTAETLTPTEDYIGKVSIALEADVEPLPDPHARSSMDFYLMGRGTKISDVDGGSPSGEYSDEVAPRMFLTEESTVQGVLLFVRDDGSAEPTVFRAPVTFDVIEGVQAKDQRTYSPKKRNRVRFVGNVTFPSGKGLAEEWAEASNGPVSIARVPTNVATKTSRWRVMAMIGYYGRSPLTRIVEGTGTQNQLYFGQGSSDDMFREGSPSVDYAYRAGRTVRVNVPCASRWETLYIAKAGGNAPVTGLNFDLLFRPQGVLLQYDISSLSADVVDVRRLGVASNVLDFRGYYDLNAPAVRAAYAAKDGDRYGVPAFIPATPSMADLSMYYAPASAAPLSHGARVFPWDMPTLSSNDGAKLENWPASGQHAWTLEQGTTVDYYPLGNVGTHDSGTHYPWMYPWISGVQRLWTFLKLGGTRKYTSYDNTTATNDPRFVFYFWGMPRTGSRLPEASKRATYMYASSYSLLSNEDVYRGDGNTFDTGSYTKLRNEAVRRYNWALRYEQTNPSHYKRLMEQDFKSDPQYNPERANFPGGLFDAYEKAKVDGQNYAAEARRNYVTPRTQPLMILHQTTRTFDERKVYHAQVVIKPDLILSEVIYEKRDGRNYSLLEISNPSYEPVDLAQYAVVRLIPNAAGTHLSYRSPSGQPVESLDQALVLPLTALLGGNDPFAGSALTSLRSTSYSYDDAHRRARPIYYGSSTWSASLLPWVGTWKWFDLQDASSTHPDRSLYMLNGQSILLGASGYVNSPVTRGRSTDAAAGYPLTAGEGVTTLVDPNSWFASLHAMMRTNRSDYSRLRYAYAYADGQLSPGAGGKASAASFGAGTLDYEPGDAFALIKRTPEGWQIVDATGPVGAQQLAFAGTYADFKAQFDPLKTATHFSQQRMDGVNYPFISPYRTRRMTSLWADDWSILTDESQFTPGRRFLYSGIENTAGDKRILYKRSPMDLSFTTYQSARPTKGY